MRILLVNDDGILAPGIEALYEAVADLGQVDVVAPETSQSAVGHGISVLTPMTVHRVHVNQVFHGWAVDGRPADCVKLAIHELVARPDFVLSGINAGANTGANVLYSGTVAGALEAAFYRIPALAFSLELSDELDFRRAGEVARKIFLAFVASQPEPGLCLNVNIPALDHGLPRGVRCCAQGAVAMQEHYQHQTDGAGRSIYWLDGRLPELDEAAVCDLAAIRQGYVAITPLRCDLTDERRLAQVRDWRWPRTFHESA
jgi:5'-nucleotidase